MRKPLTIVAIIFIGVGFFFASNIYGYFRFKSYCSNEGGLRVYEPLEKNVGWFAKDKYDAMQAAGYLKYVGFVRYKDEEDGNTYDLRYLGGDAQYDWAFEKKPSDESKPLVYKWHFVSYQSIDNEIRLNRFGYEVYDLKENKLSARYYMYEYSKLEPSHTIFSAPSSITCLQENGEKVNNFSRPLLEIITAFKN